MGRGIKINIHHRCNCRLTFLAAAAAALSGTIEKERVAAWSSTAYLHQVKSHYLLEEALLMKAIFLHDGMY